MTLDLKLPPEGAAPPSGCARCQGTGFTLVEKDGYSYAVRCDCQGAPRPPVLATLPPRFLEARFDSFLSGNTASLKRAKATVQRFAQLYPSVEGGLFLMGPEGVGKTHLCAALLLDLADKGFPGLYFEFRSLLYKLKQSFDRESGMSQAQVLEPMLSAQLVVLDGVGDEKPSEWVSDTLAYIINHRYNTKRITVATSRFFDERTRNDLKLTGTGLPLEERIGKFILSRFYEMCQFVPIVGSDFREHIKKAAFHR